MEGAGTLERQLHLLRMLASRRLGMTVEELVEETGVSTKTVRRDLERLVNVGFPVSAEVGPHGRKRWRIDGDSITGTALRFDEAFVLLLAAGMLQSLSGTGLGDALGGAIAKLRSGLSETTLRYCDRLVEGVKLTQRTTVDYSQYADILDTILIALEDRRNVFIAYQSRQSTEPITYPISPYAIRLHRDALYVIAHSEQHDEVRTFKLDRISDAEATEFPFRIPDDFDADAYLASALGIFGGKTPQHVRIRFSPRAARPLSERKWHPTQTLEPQPDGSTIASYDIAITPELVGWILSIGRDGSVIEPPELISRIREEVDLLRERYLRAVSPASGRTGDP